MTKIQHPEDNRKLLKVKSNALLVDSKIRLDNVILGAIFSFIPTPIIK